MAPVQFLAPELLRAVGAAKKSSKRKTRCLVAQNFLLLILSLNLKGSQVSGPHFSVGRIRETNSEQQIRKSDGKCWRGIVNSKLLHLKEA